MNYYLWTIGCQMNLADSRRAAEELEQLGFRETDQPQEADLILLNTCVVRQSAEDKVVGRLTSLQGLKRRRPELRMALMGCFVGDIPSLQRRFPWVDAFIKPSDLAAVLDLGQRIAGSARPAPAPPAGRPPIAVGLPISYGCDHLCTYCVVRLRRGAEVSRPVSEIVAEARDLARRGVREITLLGQNVDSYGHDLPPLFPSRPVAGDGESSSAPALSGRAPDLADLLEAVHRVEGLARIRFLTSHPADMTDRLIETAAHLPKVCEHFEVPVQSGDDAVLRRMGRGYTVAAYRDLVGRIRSAMPAVGLATDVIVGFPGETEAQFQATMRLLEDLRFDMIHVAAYSPRPGTPAEHLPDDVPPPEKARRRRALDDLQEQIVAAINVELLGQTVELLVEGRHRGRWQGRTRSNKLVFFEMGEQDWTGRLAPVRITRTGAWSMQGKVVNGEARRQHETSDHQCG